MAEQTHIEGYPHNPYRTFRFQIQWDGKTVAGLRKMTALKKTTEAIAYREAGDDSHERKLPAGTKYEPVTLEQGLTMDPVFEKWANQVNDRHQPMKPGEFRKNVIITVLDMEGKPALQYKLYDAWVSEYQAIPDLDAGTTNTVGIQSIKLEHEGWERDMELVVEKPRWPRSRR